MTALRHRVSRAQLIVIQASSDQAPPSASRTDLPRAPRCQQRHGRLRWKVADGEYHDMFTMTRNDSGLRHTGGDDDVWTTTGHLTATHAADLPPTAPDTRRRRSCRTAVCDVVDCLPFVTVLILFLCYVATVVLALFTD